MILLDTHIWVWWVHRDPRLPESCAQLISDHEKDRICVSMISVWEVAKLVEKKRLDLKMEPLAWIRLALAYPGMALLHLTPEIVVESSRLPGEFHRDPADQIIVATARLSNATLLTVDEKITGYSHVEAFPC